MLSSHTDVFVYVLWEPALYRIVPRGFAGGGAFSGKSTGHTFVEQALLVPLLCALEGWVGRMRSSHTLGGDAAALARLGIEARRSNAYASPKVGSGWACPAVFWQAARVSDRAPLAVVPPQERGGCAPPLLWRGSDAV